MGPVWDARSRKRQPHRVIDDRRRYASPSTAAHTKKPIAYIWWWRWMKPREEDRKSVCLSVGKHHLLRPWYRAQNVSHIFLYRKFWDKFKNGTKANETAVYVVISAITWRIIRIFVRCAAYCSFTHFRIGTQQHSMHSTFLGVCRDLGIT